MALVDEESWREPIKCQELVRRNRLEVCVRMKLSLSLYCRSGILNINRILVGLWKKAVSNLTVGVVSSGCILYLIFHS